MENFRRVQTCRWGGLTLYLPYPLWLMTEASPWCCQRDSPAKPLTTADECAKCQVWEPRPEAVAERGTGSGLALR